MPIALGIETSCDDTCVSLVNEKAQVLMHKTQNQDLIHQRANGVIPELASRSHGEYLVPLLDLIFKDFPRSKIDVIAVTNRPGLLGSLLVGCVTAKTLSYALNKPLVGVNHIEGHIFSTQLNLPKTIKLPAIALVASGGHSHLFKVNAINKSELIGQTLDDASGEAFDKFAKLIGFTWPGGPKVDKEAQKIKSSSSLRVFSSIKTKGLNFSFSGIKSQAHRLLENKSKDWIKKHKTDLCFHFQKTVIDHLMDKITQAYIKYPNYPLLIGGGVSANSLLRKRVTQFAREQKIQLYTPALKFCKDNAAMIAYTGLLYFLKGKSKAKVNCSPKHLNKDFFTFVNI